AASGRFRSPNWIGVKIRFATRLMANGNATCHGTFRRNAWTNTKPKLTTIIGYRICQISPMVEGAGVHDGLIRPLYQVSQSIPTPVFFSSSRDSLDLSRPGEAAATSVQFLFFATRRSA